MGLRGINDSRFNARLHQGRRGLAKHGVAGTVQSRSRARAGPRGIVAFGQGAPERSGPAMAVHPDDAGPFFYVLRETMRILFVDDDPILREFAVVNLATEHASVETA